MVGIGAGVIVVWMRIDNLKRWHQKEGHKRGDVVRGVAMWGLYCFQTLVCVRV
jgi:hypothetical protein